MDQSLSLSPGFHFLPNERELVSYLHKKVRGDDDGVVTEVDIYGDKNPWELFDKDLKKDYYVFTKLKKKNMSGCRFDRKAGSGTWKERQTKDQDKNDVHWIRKEYLLELEKKKTDANGHWIMHEYSLNADGDKANNDYVICKIKNKHASQEDYGPNGLAGVEWFLAQIRLLKQKPVENQDGAVYNCNKRRLCVVEDGQQQQLLKKSRTSETLQPEMQASSDYNVGGSSDDSITFVSLPVDPITTYASSWAMVQAKGCGEDLFAASTVGEMATFFPEDQQQGMMNNSCGNFQYGNGEDSFDPTATPPSGANLSSEDTNDQQMFHDPSEEFYFSLQELLDDPQGL